jgi:hypothetical protein
MREEVYGCSAANGKRQTANGELMPIMNVITTIKGSGVVMKGTP